MNVVLGLIFGYKTRFDVRYDLMFPSKHHNNTISLSNSYPLTFIKMSDAHLKYQVDVQICASASDLILIYSVDCTVNIYLLTISPMATGAQHGGQRENFVTCSRVFNLEENCQRSQVQQIQQHKVPACTFRNEMVLKISREFTEEPSNTIRNICS